LDYFTDFNGNICKDNLKKGGCICWCNGTWYCGSKISQEAAIKTWSVTHYFPSEWWFIWRGYWGHYSAVAPTCSQLRNKACSENIHLQVCGSWCLQSGVTIYSDVPMHPMYCPSWPLPMGPIGTLNTNFETGIGPFVEFHSSVSVNLYVFEIKVTINLKERFLYL